MRDGLNRKRPASSPDSEEFCRAKSRQGTKSKKKQDAPRKKAQGMSNYMTMFFSTFPLGLIDA